MRSLRRSRRRSHWSGCGPFLRFLNVTGTVCGWKWSMPTCCRHLWLRIFLRLGNREGRQHSLPPRRAALRRCSERFRRLPHQCEHQPRGHPHLPRRAGSYAKTRIDTAKGERWFCTEAEARAAGWRQAKR